MTKSGTYKNGSRTNFPRTRRSASRRRGLPSTPGGTGPHAGDRARRSAPHAPRVLQGLNQIKGAHEAFQPIARFHQMAQEHGTTLDQALDNYTSMEPSCATTWSPGSTRSSTTSASSHPDGQPIGLRDIAYHVLSQSPEQLRQVQMGNQPAGGRPADRRAAPGDRGLEKRPATDAYCSSNSRTRVLGRPVRGQTPAIDELGDLVKQEIELGFDLETAYQRAELLHLPPTPLRPAPQRLRPAPLPTDPFRARPEA